MSRRIIAVSLLAIAGLALGACKSNSTSSASPAGGATHAATGSTAKGAAPAADINACSLLSVADASSLVGKQYTTATPKTIATGQDACTYDIPDDSQLVIIVYQPNSGVSMDMMASVNDGKPISGVGDKAIIGDIELDAQVGDKLIAVQGAGGSLGGDQAKAVAVAKAVIAALN